MATCSLISGAEVIDEPQSHKYRVNGFVGRSMRESPICVYERKNDQTDNC
jgi:hypothetical protein